MSVVRGPKGSPPTGERNGSNGETLAGHAAQAVAPLAAATQTAHPVVRVHVPQRSWRSEQRAIKIVWRREMVRLKADRMRIVTSLVQPVLFLFVLGSGLQSIASAGTHGVNGRRSFTRASSA